MRFVDDERRQKAHNIVARADRQHMFGAQGFNEFRVGYFSLDAKHQRLTAHAVDDSRMFIGKLRELLGKFDAHGAHMLKKGRLRHQPDSSTGNRHGERIAAVSGAMCADHHAARGSFSGKARTNGETATKGFRHRHNVGCHACEFVCKEFAGAAKPCLHFIENEQDTGVITKLTNLAQGFVG